jgi:hypothetical protein
MTDDEYNQIRDNLQCVSIAYGRTLEARRLAIDCIKLHSLSRSQIGDNIESAINHLATAEAHFEIVINHLCNSHDN